MKKILLLTMTLLGSSIFAQTESEIIKSQLQKFGITNEVITDNLQHNSLDYAFTYTSTTKTITSESESTFTEVTTFDPTQPEGEQWTLVSRNDTPPTEEELSKFKKTHHSNEKIIEAKIDDSSWKLLPADDNYLKVTFRYDKKSLPGNYKFLKDCMGTLYFNKQKQELEKITYKNLGPTRFKIIKVTKLEMTVHYFKDDHGKYLIDKEDILMDIMLLGQEGESIVTNTFSDYKKVK